jgi:2-polyprenyl-3-methyl-5-hydroxy-6-metoxy-1,4-benzoquinol methylase
VSKLTSRAGQLGKAKDKARKALARGGVSIIRHEPLRPVPGNRDRAEEVGRLDADLGRIGLNDRDYDVFTSPAAVRGYLSDSRIDFLHRLLALLEANGVALEGKRVFEVGVGSGYLVRLLSEAVGPNGSVHGCDFYDELTRLASHVAPGATIFQGSIDTLRDSPERYDVVFCTEVIEHILDTETPIPTMLDLVADGGVLVVTVPNGTLDFTPAMSSDDGRSFVGHVNFWSAESWRFYIDRLTAPRRTVVGELGVTFEGDVLYALIFKS